MLTAFPPLHRICLQLLEWLALDAGYDTRNQPARQAQLDYGNQRRELSGIG
jgi:hypothetical protein